MQTKNINHSHDPQGLAHKNCQLSGSQTLPKDRMYASTSAICQSVDPSPAVDRKPIGQSGSWASNIHKLLVPLRSTKNKLMGHNTGHNTRSTPSSLKRQTSLGHLEGQFTHMPPNTSRGQGSGQHCVTDTQLTDNSVNTNMNSMSGANADQYSHTSDNQCSNGSHNLFVNESNEMDSNTEEVNDSYHIRDVCNKWFGHKQSLIHQSISSQMASAVNKSSMDSPNFSHNVKSMLSDKVVKKDIICQTSAKSAANLSDRLENVTDRHVVVVSALGFDPNRSGSLTVKPDIPPNEVMYATESAETTDCVLAVRDVVASSGDTSRASDHNYKSSSDSGHGTMRRQQNQQKNACNGISPLDLSSLDSDQSLNGVPANTWVCDTTANTTNEDKIEKMQRELKRILRDSQTDELELELSRSFQTRLSIVKESDSWTSDSPSPLPHPHQSSTSAKYYESKKDIKCMANDSKGTLATKPKQKHNTHDTIQPSGNSGNKVKACHDRASYSNRKYARAAQMSNASSKRYYTPNQSKVRTGTKGKEPYDQINCDIVSTTTARDSNYDDLSSDCTGFYGNPDNAYALRRQLQGLENIYSEIFEILGSRVKSDNNYRSRRKPFKSTSSVVSGRSSVTSRGTRDRRQRHELKRHKYDETRRRVKRLECHVITLARSVAQLSTDIRYNQSLSQEMDRLRQEVDAVRNQMMALKQSLGPNVLGISSRPQQPSNGHISANGRHNSSHIINPNKVEKLKRFFGDEPPLLRQFLKKLGYEKYARNFESEKIGITELPYLSEERMQKLGIPLGPRMRIMQEWQDRRERQQTPQPSGGPSAPPPSNSRAKGHFPSASHLNADSYSIYAIV